MAVKDELKLLKAKREVQKEINELKKRSNELDDSELKRLKVLEDRKRRISKIQAKANADKEKAELSFIGIASKVSQLQDDIGKRITRNGREIFQFSNSFKLAASSMQPMVRGGMQMTDTYQGLAEIMDKMQKSADLAENYLGGGSKAMAGTTSEMTAAIDEWTKNIGGEASLATPEMDKEGNVIRTTYDISGNKEVMEHAQSMLNIYLPLKERFEEAVSTMGQGLTNINGLQSDNIGLAAEMATSYSKLGTSGYQPSVDKAEELYEQSLKQAKITRSVILPDMKKKLKFMTMELSKLSKASPEYSSMSEAMKEMQNDMKEMDESAQVMVDTGAQNLTNANRMRQMNNQIGASMDYILAPHEKLKSIMESLPFGKMISSFVDLEGLGKGFGDNIQKNLVGAFSEPTVALEEYTTKTGKIAERYRDLSTGQLVSKDDDSVLTLNDMDSSLDNITAGAQDYTKKLGAGLKAATKGAWQFAKAALANPYVAVAAAIALIGVLLYKAMSYAEAMRQEFGVTRGEAFGIQTAVDATAMNFKLLGVSAEDVGTMAQGIADNMGGVSNITEENLSAMAELQGLYGMSADSIAPAMTAMKGLGAESNEAASAQLAQIGHMAQMEGVAPAKVFEDMTANMGTFSRFGKEGGKNLAEAAIMARKLGTSLESMAATSDALLDFESSINDQMEASMLTGRTINMDKARELALAGDIAGQEREILKQLGTQAEFEAMNVVQRDALAKATGKSTEDISTMLANQANLNSMTAAQRADKEAMQKADEKVNKGMKDMGSQLGDLFKSMMEPLKELMVALGPTLGVILKVLAVTLKTAFLPLKLVFFLLNPIIKGIGWLLSNLKIIGMVAATIIFPPFALIAGIGILIYKNFDKIKDVVSAVGKSIFDFMMKPINFVLDGIKSMVTALGGFKNMAMTALKIAFAPLFLAYKIFQSAKNFIGSFFGGGDKSTEAVSSATSGGAPEMHSGGVVKETGNAVVEKGEVVSTPQQQQQQQQQQSSTMSTQAMESKLDQLIDLLGQSGPISMGVGGVKSNTKAISEQIV